MSVALDVLTHSTANNVGSKTLSHAGGTPSAVAILVHQYIQGGLSRPVNSVTYNGVALTKAVSFATGTAEVDANVEIWGSDGFTPAAGTQNSFVSVSGGNSYWEQTVASVTGSDTTTCFRDSGGEATSGSSWSKTLTTTVDDFCVDVSTLVGNSNTESANGGQTEQFNFVWLSVHVVGCSTKASAGASTSMGWSCPAPVLHAYAAAAFKAAAAGPTTQSYVIGAARIASRFVGPQVQRFMFRQPIGIFGGVVLDPPGQTVAAVVLANPMVGPPVMRQRARRPFLSGPVASGATSVLSPLVVHTYTARAPQVQASVKPAQVTHTYTAQTPQVRASVKPSQATHTYVGQVPQVRAQVRPGQVTHTYTARVPVVSAGTRVQVAQVTHTYTAQVPQVRAQVRPAQATHTYTGRVPNIVSGASIIPPVVTHTYTGRVPQVRAQVRPAQVTHSYTARVPQVQIATRVSAALVTHSYTSRVPGFKTSIPAPRITHTYTSRVPAVVIAGAPVYGFGARARIGAASARDPWSRIGSASATDANKKIGSDKA